MQPRSEQLNLSRAQIELLRAVWSLRLVASNVLLNARSDLLPDYAHR